MKSAFERFFRRQFGQVLGHADVVLFELQQFNALIRFLRAENQTDRGVFTRLAFVAVEPAEIEQRLPEVGRFGQVAWALLGKYNQRKSGS